MLGKLARAWGPTVLTSKTKSSMVLVTSHVSLKYWHCGQKCVMSLLMTCMMGQNVFSQVCRCSQTEGDGCQIPWRRGLVFRGTSRRNGLTRTSWSRVSANVRFSLSSSVHLKTDTEPMQEVQWRPQTQRGLEDDTGQEGQQEVLFFFSLRVKGSCSGRNQFLCGRALK